VAFPSAGVSLVDGLMNRRLWREEPGVKVTDHWVVVDLWSEKCRVFDWTARDAKKERNKSR
jgi:hypothetical protein